jgi:ribosomal protein S21
MILSALSPSDAAAFGEVVHRLQAARGGSPPRQEDFEALASLVESHGAPAVLAAIGDATVLGYSPLRVGHLSALLELEDPILRQVMGLYAQEIEPHQRITPKVRETLIGLVDEFPDLAGWREAVGRAVKSNHRRLASVEKILRQHKETGSWDPPSKSRNRQDATAPKPARRAASRETKYDEEELRRLREQEVAGKWERPTDLF